VTGTTLLQIVAFPPSDAPVSTSGNGFELVRVGGGVSADQFALAAPVAIGALEYVLTYLPNYSGDLDGFFLQSRPRSEFAAEAAMLAAGQALVGACFRGGDDLAGDDLARRGGAWASVTRGSRETGANTGIDTDQNFTCGSGGVDAMRGEDVRVGLAGGYGKTDVDVNTVAGVATLNGDGGVIRAYGTYSQGPMFVDLSLGYGNINWSYNRPLLAAPAAAGVSGVVGAVQAGAFWRPLEDWRIAAVAELAYDDMKCTESCLIEGTTDDVNNWFARASVRLDGALYDGTILSFVAVSLAESFGANDISHGAAVITTDTAANQLTAKAGLTAFIRDNAALFTSVGVIEGLDNDVSGLDGTAGIKLYW
jgi:outer membrane autotransporter protein